jgi:hypothetical protein
VTLRAILVLEPAFTGAAPGGGWEANAPKPLVRKTPSFEPYVFQIRALYQDRLVTNIGKVENQKKRHCLQAPKTFTLVGWKTDGVALPASQPRPRRIELIGDSISAVWKRVFCFGAILYTATESLPRQAWEGQAQES